MSIPKAERIMTAVARITDLYQIEIVKPALDYVLTQSITPFDNYEHGVSILGDFKQTPMSQIPMVNLRSFKKN